MQFKCTELTSTDPRIHIGRFSYGVPQFMLWGDQERIKIGSFCSIANEVAIFGGGEHRIDWITTYPLRIAFDDPSAGKDGLPASKGETTIGNDVWIGYRTIILSGVNIGHGAVVGAGSVVVKDVPPYAVVAGNPAKIIRYRFSNEEIDKLLSISWWDWDINRIKTHIPLLCSTNIQKILNIEEPIKSLNKREHVMNTLDTIKQQKWFYEFNLPDGTQTESYLPEIVRPIHTTREKALRQYLTPAKNENVTALDISCHEGFFSLVLREYFNKVVGIDKNQDSLNKAKLIASCLSHSDILFEHSSLENWADDRDADFVLCFGLLYHVENPLQILRKLALLTKKTACIETQVLPFNLTGSIEDGSYLWQRELHGLFGLCADYSDNTEGGLTNLALVPSRESLEFLLKQFGFKEVKFYIPDANDYEQFNRGHRVIVYAEK